MRLYVYSAPGQMVNHTFTDDVAITFARSKKEAVEQFRGIYRNCEASDVVSYSKRTLEKYVVILTDY